MLLLRLALFTVLVPGVVAGYLPWLFASQPLGTRHLVVVLLEEPHLRSRDPATYEAFIHSTPRWLGPHRKA